MPMSPALLRPKKPSASFNPQQLAGLSLWLDAADAGTLYQNQGGTTPVTASGQPVFQWNDKSGNGRNATTPRVISRINLTSGGSGYTLAPTVTISDSGGGSGSGATATATISGGSVNGLTLTARGTQYSNPVVTLTRAAGDTTGVGAAATATATSFPARAVAPAGVVFNTLNTGNALTYDGPHMALPALAIPDSHTVFSVFSRVDSQYSLPIGSGFDTPSIASAQGSRYGVGMFTDNIVYTAAPSQSAFTTHQPRQGLGGQVVILRGVRTAGTSVATRLNDLPVSTVTSGSGVTQSASGSWSGIGCDVSTTSNPGAGNQLLRLHRGPLHEVIVYDRALTPEEQAAVTEYLRAKWGVTFGLWTPNFLGGNLAAWYDAAATSTLTLNGSTVSQWRDNSGNARHVTQSINAANQPTYTPNGLNGKPTLTFEGFDALLNPSAGVMRNIGGATVAMVMARPANPTTEAVGLFVAMGTGGTRLNMSYKNPNAGEGFASGGRRLAADAFQVATAFAYTSNPIIAVGRHDYANANLSIWQNGTAGDSRVYQTAGVTENNGGEVTIGAANITGQSFFFGGNISEIVLVHSALSTTDRQRLEGYLAHKWGMTANLPADHPYKLSPPTV